MKKTELVSLFKVIKECYQNFEITPEKIEVWYEIIQDTPFEKALANLMIHIKSSAYVPTLADLIKYDPVQTVDHEKQKIETQERLIRLSTPAPSITPEEMAEIKRKVEAGEYDEQFKDDPYLGRGRIGD